MPFSFSPNGSRVNATALPQPVTYLRERRRAAPKASRPKPTKIRLAGSGTLESLEVRTRYASPAEATLIEAQLAPGLKCNDPHQ